MGFFVQNVGNLLLHDMQNVILYKIKFNPCKVGLNINKIGKFGKTRKTQKTGTLKFYDVFEFSDVQLNLRANLVYAR